MGSRRWTSALGLLAAAGCQPSQALPPPPFEGGSALLLAVVEGGRVTNLSAHAGLATLPDLSLRDGVTLQAATFNRSLEQLRLSPGAIDLGAGGGELLPEPVAIYELREAGAGWAPLPELGIWATIEVPRLPVPCGVLRIDGVRERPLEASESAGRVFSGTYPRERSFNIVAGNPRGIWLATAGAPLATTTASRGLDFSSPPIAATPGPLESYYAFARGGWLWESVRQPGRPGPFRRVGRAPGASDAEAAWMATATGDETFELYVLDSNGGLWRYEDEAGPIWTTIVEPGPAPPSIVGGGVVRIDEREVYFIRPADGQVLRAVDLDVREAGPPELVRATAIAQVPNHGLIVGEASGRVWRRDPGGWQELPAAPAGPITAIGAFYGAGVLYGGPGALQFFSDGDPCRAAIPIRGLPFAMTFRGRNDFGVFTSEATDTLAAPIVGVEIER